MKKIMLILALTLIVAGCELRQASADQQTITHDYEQDGLALKATITIAKNIIVDASITNDSGKTIIYNERCGVPFSISVKKGDAQTHLAARGEKLIACDSMFDPNDLREMKPGQTFEKEVTFKRELRLTNGRTVSALSGVYEVNFAFQPHENKRFYSSLPIELTMDNNPEIMTVDQAKSKAKANKEVSEWFEKREKGDMLIKSEEPILSDDMWTVMFHAIHEDRDSADRIVINMDATSGEVKAVHYEELNKEVLEMLVK